MTRSGDRQYPNAVSLILIDADGKRRRLYLRSLQQVDSSAEQSLLVPVPVGASFSLPVDLDNYFSTSEGFGYKVMPGTYLVEAQLLGAGQFPSFREMDPQGRRFIGIKDDFPPTTNKLRIEVPSR
jgi:hypothetical protein